MTRVFAVLALTVVLAGCPSYDEYPKLSDQKGYVPADQYARYGRKITPISPEEAQKYAASDNYARAWELWKKKAK